MAAVAGAAAGFARNARDTAQVRERVFVRQSQADLLLAVVNQVDKWQSPRGPPGFWKRNRLNLLFCASVLAYLWAAAAYYKYNNGWLWSQSWLVSVDVFCAIGYGTMTEGDGDPMDSSSFKAWDSSMAFTIFHTIMGGIMISFFLAFVILYMIDAREQLINRAMSSSRGLNWRERAKKWAAEHFELVVSTALYLVWLLVGLIGTQTFTDYTMLTSVYYSVSSMSTGGLQGPDPNSQVELVFCTVYSLIGVPIFALLLSVLSGLIVEYVETRKLQARLLSPITESEFNYVDEVLGKGELEFGGFLILTLAKLGKMDNSLMEVIKKRFDFLDVDGDGSFTRTEMEVMLEFERFDADNSGTIEIDEFTHVIMNMHHKNPGTLKVDPVSILEMFNEIDTASSGMLDKHEFLLWWRGIQGGNKSTRDSSRTVAESVDRNPPRMNTFTFNSLLQGITGDNPKFKLPAKKRAPNRPTPHATWAETPRNGMNMLNRSDNDQQGNSRDRAHSNGGRAHNAEAQKRRKAKRRTERERPAARPSTQTNMTGTFGQMAL